MSYKNNRDSKDNRDNLAFIGVIDAKKLFRHVLGNDEINGDVIRRLWAERQAKIAYINTVKTDYFVYKRMRTYLDAFMAEFNRLILNAIGSLSTKEPTLSFKDWV